MPLLESNETFKFTYDTMLQWFADTSDGDIVRIDAAMEQIAREYDITKGEVLANFLRDRGFEINQAADGSWRGSFYANPANFNVQTNPINSNMSNVYRGSVRQWYSNTPQFDTSTGFTFLKPSRFPVSGGLGQQAIYTVASVGSAINAVSAGISLGKIFDGALYNANPDFWNSIGMESLNPQTWASLTNESDSPFAGLFNMILGIDPTTGKTQAYMDENAFAYMAYAMAKSGIFDTPQTTVIFTPEELSYGLTHSWKSPLIIFDTSGYVLMHEYRSGVYDFYQTYSCSGTAPIYTIGLQSGVNTVSLIMLISEQPFTMTRVRSDTGDTVITQATHTAATTNYPSFYSTNIGGGGSSYQMTPPVGGRYSEIVGGNVSNCGNVHADGSYWTSSTNQDTRLRDAAIILFGGGHIHSSGGIDGISDQPNATLPDVSEWDSLDDVLPSLQQQYPSMFADPLIWDNVQPDGTNPQLRYVPVAMPEATSAIDTQPTTGTQTQTQTQIGTGLSTDTLLQLITDLMTQTQPDTATQTVPQNPTDTGTGDTTPPIIPAGNASALWSVYHPTQAQVNQFGAWLWTDNIITKIQQLLQNPMEGIITLHKVFATPVDSGNGTIVVGRLDSEVPSATVNQQYVTVDCGSIDCYEQFGNVFDYSPHTNISLYLPFIGIVPLNVDDVMRSSVHVIYGVDVFTGACLAMVEVTRDGNTINLYQYSGVASVEYPLTGSVHSGLITGILGVAGSVAATVATGGVTAPAAIAAVGGIASAGKSQNARAGGFSGNAGAMGIKIPYLIIERPQTKVADTFAELSGYPTNYSCKLGDCSGHVTVKHAHIHGMNATESELNQIETLLKSGVIV